MRVGRSIYVVFIVILLAGLPGTIEAQKETKQAVHHLSGYFPDPVYVSLQKTGAVERFPDEKVFTGFPGAHYLSVDSESEMLVVSGFRTGRVYIADAQTGKKKATLQIGQVVQGVKIDPSGQYALAVNAPEGKVAVINLNKLAVVKSISVGEKPHNVVYSQSGRKAYVTLQGENRLAVIDMQRLEKIREVEVTGMDGPHNLDIDRNGHKLWIRSHPNRSEEKGQVAVLNIDSGEVENMIQVGPSHGGIDIQPDIPFAITSDIGSNTVELINRKTQQKAQTIEAGEGPHGVRFSRNGRWAYVTATRANQLAVLDMRTGKIVRRIKTKGAFPFWIAGEGD